MIYGAGCTVIGAILGAVASWYFSRKYYLKSGIDLDSATRKILRAHNVVATLRREGMNATAIYDTDGYLSGVTVSATGHAEGSSTATGGGSFTIKPPPQYDRQHEQPPSQTQEVRDV